MAKQNERVYKMKRNQAVKAHRKVGSRARRLASKTRRFEADQLSAKQGGKPAKRTTPTFQV